MHPEQQQKFFTACNISLKSEKVSIDLQIVPPGEKAKYEWAYVIFVMARSMVCVSFNPVEVLNNMAVWDFKNEKKRFFI